jgi:hypothetical protein
LHEVRRHQAHRVNPPGAPEDFQEARVEIFYFVNTTGSG